MNFSGEPKFSLSKLRGSNNEGIMVLVLLTIVVVMSLVGTNFFSIATLFAIIRASIVPMLLALSVLIILISGGIDVSFPAIAIFAAYTTATLALNGTIDASLIMIFVVALFFGIALGAVNGVIIAKFRLPTLIVTLGTQTIFKGALLAYVGTRYLGALPPVFNTLGSTNIVTVTVESTTSAGVVVSSNASINLLVIPVVLISLAVGYLLKHTMFGRGVYAIGGDYEAARRAGFPVVRIQVLLYMLSGALAATAGIFHIALNRSANAQDLVGDELLVIAAVVLGGASIFGGRGSIFGTMLGVVLIQLFNNTLILVGVPQVWQRAAVGILLLIGVTIQAYSNKKQQKKFNVTVLAEELKEKK